MTTPSPSEPDSPISPKLPCWRFFRYFIHEIRTPLNAVHGFAELLKDEPDPVEVQQNIRRIQRNVHALEELISSAAEVVQIEEGAFHYIPREFNPRPLLKDLSDLAHLLLRQKGVTFEIRADALPPTIWADEHRFRQVLTNLVTNAVRFTEQGTVVLELAPGAGGGLFVEVRDSGPGISPDDLARLKVPLNLAESDPFPRVAGGLGLIIVRRILELMDTQLEIESTLGQGTRASFSLPPKG